MSTIIDKLYDEIKSLMTFLEEKEEPTFQSFSGDNFRKTLLLASGSLYENQIQEIIHKFVLKRSNRNSAIYSMINQKVMYRKYHTYFNWDCKNANQFFALFGDKFKEAMKEKVRTDNEFCESIESFMQIGSDRNRLVHQNYATYVLDKTTEDIYKLHLSAQKFIDVFEKEILEFDLKHD